MILTWDADPILFSLGPISVHWYGALFGTGFILGFQATQWIFKREGQPLAVLDSLFFHVFLGTLIGARLGHVLFYEPDVYLRNPLAILRIWEGGLASHGGGLGVILALYLFHRKHPKLGFVWLLDRLVFATIITGVLIRLGNFFNSEILGKPTGADWGVIFARVDPRSPRHPAQLYESASYFLIFLGLSWLYLKKDAGKHRGALIGVFLVAVFTVRFLIEFVKENQAGFEQGLPLNMGQLLSLPMILAGAWLLARSGFLGSRRSST